MEAWRRALDEPVRTFPIEQAGPAHIATLKTFEPPLSALDGRRLAGAARRPGRRGGGGPGLGRAAAPRAASRPARERRHRPRVGERDPPPRAAVSVRLVRGPAPGTGPPPGRGDRRRAFARPRAARARRG